MCKLTKRKKLNFLKNNGNFVTDRVLENQQSVTITDPNNTTNINKQKYSRMNYTNKKHLKLLKLFLDSKKIKPENLECELIEYEIIVTDEIFWNDRKAFVLLMTNFIYNIINYEQFEIDFSLLSRKVTDYLLSVQRNLKRIQNFQISPKSSQFGFPMMVIFGQFEEVEAEYSNSNEQEIHDNVIPIVNEIQWELLKPSAKKLPLLSLAKIISLVVNSKK